VNQSILPKWYIDTDDPILVFYLSDKKEAININNLPTLSNSWVRGFHFDRFIDENTNFYEVNTPSEGFTLLANNRIDTFIDYLSNVPAELAQKFKHFELLPSRHLYIAFQNNQHGKKLAKIYDQKMSFLRESGKLSEIYADLYKKSELETFEENKIKMVILTDEVNLIRGYKKTNKFENQILSNTLNLLFDQLNEYDFEFKIVNDYANITQYSNKENLCFSDMLKTQEREEYFYYSDPFALYLGLKVYSKNPLSTNSDNKVNLSLLLEQNPKNKIGVVTGRSFGHQIDQQLDKLNNNQIIEIPAKLNSILTIFNHNRFDFLIEYPQYVDILWPNISDKNLYSYPIAGGDLFSVGHMMCAKTDINKKFISRLNKSIETIRKSGALYNVLSNEIHTDQQTEFKEYFVDVFTNQGPSN
ncbi:MAG: hypothetical protein KC484_11835, partial [Colwelliaceae bacterium]|nr:hypothetical protein [Colwelliaceae bacterium]